MPKKPRRDTYKNFNFRVAIGAVLVGLAALVVAKKAKLVRPEAEPVRRNAFWRMFGME